MDVKINYDEKRSEAREFVRQKEEERRREIKRKISGNEGEELMIKELTR